MVIADLPAVNQFKSLWGCLVAFLGAFFVMESNAEPIGDVEGRDNKIIQQLTLLEGDLEFYLDAHQWDVNPYNAKVALKKRIAKIKSLINE